VVEPKLANLTFEQAAAVPLVGNIASGACATYSYGQGVVLT
jgi:hypothetical protein